VQLKQGFAEGADGPAREERKLLCFEGNRLR